MQAAAVESTTLVSVAYDAGRELLQLEFRNGTIYQYLGVPAEVHEALLRAPSKGQYFNRAIRGQFPYIGPAPSMVPRGDETKKENLNDRVRGRFLS